MAHGVHRLLLAVTVLAFLHPSAAQASSRPLVAVLDLDGAQAKLSEAEIAALTNTVRKQALDLLSARYDIITRENLIDLLKAHGKQLEKCIGECETETGRLIGADMVITGSVTDVFGSFRLDLKAHRTDPPTFLAAEEASIKERSDLPKIARDGARRLFSKLVEKPAKEAKVAEAAAAPAPPPKADPTDLLWAVLRDFRQRWWAPASEIKARYQRACRAGVELACHYETWHHKSGASRERALEPMELACEAGNMTGCLVAGWIRSQGYGPFDVPAVDGPDPEGAAQLFAQACKQGLLRACTALGRLYDYGVGVRPDQKLANKLYQGSCDGGDMRGCANLSWSYLRGEEVPEDPKRANALLVRACEGGFAAGCHYLADHRALGKGLPQNWVKAAERYKQACQGGYLKSCARLATCFEHGRGVEQDRAIAKKLSLYACENGYQKACP